MNILHLSPYLPSVDENHAGGICMGKQVETLKKLHQVFVVSFVVTDLDKKIAAGLSKEIYYCYTLSKLDKAWNVITHFWLPAYYATRSDRRLKKELIKLVQDKKIEAVHAEYAAMGQYVWLKKRFPGLIFNLVEHDFTEQSYERKIDGEKNIFKYVYYKSQLLMVRYWEKKYCTKADQLFVFNEKDRKLISARYGIQDIKVLNPYYGMDKLSIENKRTFKKYRICFVGQMARSENYEAAARLIDICREVKKEIPNLELSILGNDPPNELRSQKNDWIEISGYVPDIDEEIKKCHLAVFPLSKGAGIKLKVLKCLALGVPVVTSEVGAEGIDEEGEILSIARSDKEFSIKIKQILYDDTVYEKMSEKGRLFSDEKFGWKKTEKVFLSVYSKQFRKME